MLIRRRLLATVLACLLLGVPGAADAQLSEDDIERFKELTAEGARHYENEEYEESLAALRKAQAMYDHPDLAFNIGRTLSRMQRCSEARTTFETYIEREDVSEEDVAKAQASLQDLESCRETGTVRFACNTEATLDVADRSIDCPGELELEPGDYVVSASAPDHEPAERTFSIRRGSETSVTLELVESAPPPVVEPPPPEPADGPRWTTWAGWTGVGVGVGLVGTAVFLDSRSPARGRELEEATAAGDTERVAALQNEARGARTRLIILYAGGIVAAGAGTTLLLLGSGDDSATALGLHLSPSGIAASIRW